MDFKIEKQLNDTEAQQEAYACIVNEYNSLINKYNEKLIQKHIVTEKTYFYGNDNTMNPDAEQHIKFFDEHMRELQSKINRLKPLVEKLTATNK